MMTAIKDFDFGTLKSSEFDVAAIKKEYYRQNGRACVKALEKHNFDAHFCDTKEEARELILSLVPDCATIGCGDSHTLFAVDLDEGLKTKGCTVIPHTRANNVHSYRAADFGNVRMGTEEDAREILRHYLAADVFMLSANAVTLDGQIINIDGEGNRVAGSIYGSDRIIVVAGANKIVKDLDAGLERIHFVAAHMNNIKYDQKLPCTVTGVCSDCNSKSRNCNITSIIHRRPVNSDFHVIIIAEELGF